jgi:hypothetical protein
MYQEDWQKREHSQHFGNPDRTGSDQVKNVIRAAN